VDLGYEYKQLDVGKGRSLGKTPKKQEKTRIKPSVGLTKKPFRILDVTDQEEGMGFIFLGGMARQRKTTPGRKAIPKAKPPTGGTISPPRR
jgi:hypothetical protein